MNHDEITAEIEYLFPRNISDESAVVLCDFLAKLLLVADNRYLHNLRRYREAQAVHTGRSVLQIISGCNIFSICQEGKWRALRHRVVGSRVRPTSEQAVKAIRKIGGIGRPA